MAAEARAVVPGKGLDVVALRQARRGDGRPALRFRLGRHARYRCRCWLSCCQGSCRQDRNHGCHAPCLWESFVSLVFITLSRSRVDGIQGGFNFWGL